MSGLRQIHKETIPEEDLEALIQDKDEPVVKRSAPTGGASSHNPVFLGKVIFQKVVGLISSDEEEDASPGGLITLLRDIIVGVVFGVVTISVLVFLDHKDVVHFQSAHNFRNAAFNMLNDPETIATLEESTGMKFLTISDYDAKRKEIDSVAAKIVSHQEVLDKRIAESENKKKEVVALKEEHTRVMNHPLLGLDKYCGGCKWSMQGQTCDARVAFLQEKYNTPTIVGKVSAMAHVGCMGG